MTFTGTPQTKAVGKSSYIVSVVGPSRSPCQILPMSQLHLPAGKAAYLAGRRGTQRPHRQLRRRSSPKCRPPLEGGAGEAPLAWPPGKAPVGPSEGGCTLRCRRGNGRRSSLGGGGSSEKRAPFSRGTSETCCRKDEMSVYCIQTDTPNAIFFFK